MKHLFSILILSIFSIGVVSAQKAWVVPEEFNPGDSITLFVDVSKTDCSRLMGTTEPVYLWMWNPSEPVIGNGDWTASNPDMQMTQDPNNPNVYYFSLVPEQFFTLDSPSDLYDKGFSFLAKLSDGTGEGGGGCDEDKTEDLNVAAKPIPGCNSKFCQFPGVLFWDDYFTFLYDNTLEDKPSMDESAVGIENFSMYIRVVYDDGSKGTYVSYGDVINHPELSLIKEGDGYYKRTFIFSEMLADLVVDGKTITKVEISVMDKAYTNGPNSVSDGKHVVTVGCK